MTLETPVWMQQGSFPSQLDRLVLDAMFEPGVLDAQAAPIQVAPASADLRCSASVSTLSVDVAPGVAVIAGTDQTRQGKYLVRSTTTENRPLDPRPAGGQSRIDLIYARVRDSSSGIGSADDWIIDKVTGVPAGSPVVPGLPSSAIALARAIVAGGAGPPTLAPTEVIDVRTRARARMPTQGWHLPILSRTTGNAGTVSGQSWNATITVPPQPCGYLASVHYHCYLVTADVGGVFEARAGYLPTGSPPQTILGLGRGDVSVGRSLTLDAEGTLMVADGSGRVFTGELYRESGTGSASFFNDPLLHVLSVRLDLNP